MQMLMLREMDVGKGMNHFRPNAPKAKSGGSLLLTRLYNRKIKGRLSTKIFVVKP
jgi:hypothetical protein